MSYHESEPPVGLITLSLAAIMVVTGILFYVLFSAVGDIGVFEATDIAGYAGEIAVLLFAGAGIVLVAFIMESGR